VLTAHARAGRADCEGSGGVCVLLPPSDAGNAVEIALKAIYNTDAYGARDKRESVRQVHHRKVLEAASGGILSPYDILYPGRVRCSPHAISQRMFGRTADICFHRLLSSIRPYQDGLTFARTAQALVAS